MKKTYNINIAGQAFIIDEEAFETLNQYLEALKQKFSNQQERDEILSDIESRIAEMLNHKLTDKKEVVGLADVNEIISAMGKPEDIAGEGADSSNPSAENKQTNFTSGNATAPKKRLYRDPDDAYIGGVISGFCHYFGINDPTWIRLAVVLLMMLSAGTIALIYFILYMVVPEAETASEKLQMKGEPVNINNIEKEIKDNVTRISSNVNKWAKSDNIADRILALIITVGRVVLKIMAVGVILLCFLLLFILATSFFGISVLSSDSLSQVSHLLVDKTSLITLWNIGLLLTVGIPLMSIIYSCFRYLLNIKRKIYGLRMGMVVAWLLGIFLLFYSTRVTLRNFKHGSSVHNFVPIIQPATGNLYVTLSDSLGNEDGDDEDSKNNGLNVWQNGNIGLIMINGKSIITPTGFTVGQPSIKLYPSKTDSFQLDKMVYSSGLTRADVEKNIAAINYNLAQTDSVITLGETFEVNKAGKWRAQKIWIRLYIPEGKKVHFGKNIDELAATVHNDRSYDDTYFANTTWTTENGKVKCLDCAETDADQSTKKHSRHSSKKDKDEDNDSDNDKGNW